MGYEAVMIKGWSSLVPRTLDFSKRGLGTGQEVEVVTPMNTVPTTLSCDLMSWARPSHRRGCGQKQGSISHNLMSLIFHLWFNSLRVGLLTCETNGSLLVLYHR